MIPVSCEGSLSLGLTEATCVYYIATVQKLHSTGCGLSCVTVTQVQTLSCPTSFIY